MIDRDGWSTEFGPQGGEKVDHSLGITVCDRSRKKEAVSLLKEGDIGMFYSKSKSVDDLGINCDHWRKVLSNFHPVEVEIDGCKYPSPEHAFHAAKVKCSSDPGKSKEFEVGGSISHGPAAAKRMGGKGGFKQLGIELDVDKWNAVRDEEMLKILKYRFENEELFKMILMEISKKKITLLHFERSGKGSYWGGAIRKEDHQVVGRNRLGEMMMSLV
tara:strand:- start:1662 stop:2309 length:648 start_codon:yes stop_codon:yes gene_type:complete